jgi:hypothetical protein
MTHETHHTDILPSLLEWLGHGRAPADRGLFAAAPRAWDAQRAWDAMSSRAGFAEADPEHIRDFVFARKEGDWKYHLHMDGDRVTRRLLFDLSSDPEERRDLSLQEPERARRMEAAILAQRAAMRLPSMAVVRAVPVTERPVWVFPPSSGAYAYADLGGRFRLEWTGDPKGSYVIEYVAGEGERALAGEMRVAGTVKDFGKIERAYWNTFIVPYATYRVRVGPAGRADLWSPWLELEARPSP